MSPAEAKTWLDRVPPDEPVFVLRAQDVLAPGCVQSWGAVCISSKEPKTRLKGEQAMHLADEMRKWQEQHGYKMPD